MRSTLNQTDPHDVLVVAPDVVLVARADKEFSNLAHDAMSRPTDSQTHMGSDFSAGPSVPPVDTTFRASAVDKVQIPGRPSIGARTLRAFIGFLLALCIGVAGIVWQSHGDAVKQMVARWVPQFVLTSSLPLEKLGLPEQPSPPAVQASAAKAAPPQPAPPAQTAPDGAAPTTAAASPESAQMLQSMARDLASLREEIEQLKGSQQQMSRDIAKASEARASETRASEARASDVRASDVRASDVRASEQNMRPRISAISPPPRRPAVAPARRPMPPLPSPQAAAAPLLPQAVAPYVPPQPEPQPQAAAQPQDEPVLRPPMPVR